MTANMMPRETADQLVIQFRFSDALYALVTNRGEGSRAVADAHNVLALQYERELDRKRNSNRRELFTGRYPEMSHELIEDRPFEQGVMTLELHLIRLFDRLIGDRDPLAFLESAIGLLRRSYLGEEIDHQEVVDSKLREFLQDLIDAAPTFSLFGRW